jgi:hypothetical protein
MMKSDRIMRRWNRALKRGHRYMNKCEKIIADCEKYGKEHHEAIIDEALNRAFKRIGKKRKENETKDSPQ